MNRDRNSHDSLVRSLFGDIPSMSIVVANPSHDADSVLKKLDELGVLTYVDLVGNPPDFYSDWKSNEHHWTTRFVFEKVMPIVWNFLGVRPDVSKLEPVENIVDGHDVSYHRHTEKLRYHVLNLDDTCQIHGPHDGLRDVHGKIHNDQFQTGYHRLFVGAHRNCIVKTDSSGSGIRLALNSDSMAIPVIPLVAPYV